MLEGEIMFGVSFTEEASRKTAGSAITATSLVSYGEGMSQDSASEVAATLGHSLMNPIAV